MWSIEHGHLVRAVFGIPLNTIIRSRAGPTRLPQDAANSTLEARTQAGRLCTLMITNHSRFRVWAESGAAAA
jgi:hypothetical protein